MMPSKTYDNLKNEDALDRELKASIARGDLEAKQNAIIEKYEPPKPAPEGIAL